MTNTDVPKDFPADFYDLTRWGVGENIGVQDSADTVTLDGDVSLATTKTIEVSCSAQAGPDTAILSNVRLSGVKTGAIHGTLPLAITEG